MMDENGEISAEAAAAISDADRSKESVPTEAAIDASALNNPLLNGEIRTLDGDIAGDEFASDAINYQLLLGKLEKLLERLKLDA